MRKIVKIGLVGIAVLASISMTVRAEGPDISGYVDTTYNYNFNNPDSGENAVNPYEKKDDTILINAVHLQFMGTKGNLGYNVQLDAGSDAQVNNAWSVGSTSIFDVQEAYFTYKFGESKLGIQGGKFATYEGIEVIESPSNPTITRGYLYYYAEPFTTVGGVVTYAANDKLDFAAGVVNGWDKAVDNNKEKTAVGKIGLNLGDPLALTLSGYYGPEEATATCKQTSIDLTMVTKVIPKTTLYLQYNYGSAKQTKDWNTVGVGVPGSGTSVWQGFGIQPVVAITPKFSVGGRVEYFSDPSSYRIQSNPLNTYMTNYTITPAYKLDDNLTFRAEYRYDTANTNAFAYKDTMVNYQKLMTVEFVVTF